MKQIRRKSKKQKPPLLHFGVFIAAVFAITLITKINLISSSPIYSKIFHSNFLATILPQVLINETNTDRNKQNLPSLASNSLLEKAATLKAQDMIKNQYFAHSSPSGINPWYWLDKVGYNFSSAGENLAMNFFESEDVARAWMDSPPHEANILNKHYTEMGVGVAEGTYQNKKVVFIVEFFGNPAL